jgi:hypothetical protein
MGWVVWATKYFFLNAESWIYGWYGCGEFFLDVNLHWPEARTANLRCPEREVPTCILLHRSMAVWIIS